MKHRTKQMTVDSYECDNCNTLYSAIDFNFKLCFVCEKEVCVNCTQYSKGCTPICLSCFNADKQKHEL